MEDGWQAFPGPGVDRDRAPLLEEELWKDTLFIRLGGGVWWPAHPKPDLLWGRGQARGSAALGSKGCGPWPAALFYWRLGIWRETYPNLSSLA